MRRRDWVEQSALSIHSETHIAGIWKRFSMEKGCLWSGIAGNWLWARNSFRWLLAINFWMKLLKALHSTESLTVVKTLVCVAPLGWDLQRRWRLPQNTGFRCLIDLKDQNIKRMQNRSRVGRTLSVQDCLDSRGCSPPILHTYSHSKRESTHNLSRTWSMTKQDIMGQVS